MPAKAFSCIGMWQETQSEERSTGSLVWSLSGSAWQRRQELL